MATRHPATTTERVTTWIGSGASLAVHTAVFIGAFAVALFGLAAWETVLLVVTTIVSLEAIYLAIFIQMSVNRAQQSLIEVEEDVAEIEENIDQIEENISDISEDIEGIEKDVAEIEENIDDISEDIEGIEKDVAEIEENIDEVSEDIEDLQENIDELAEGETRDGIRKKKQEVTLSEISEILKKLITDIETLKQQK